MIIVYSGQSNELRLKAVAKASGSPITSGTCNFYLECTSGTNAGKWYRGSDDTWQAAESLAGAGTHVKDGDWSLTLDSGVWESHAHYRLTIVESGDLHVPNADDILCAPYGGSIVSGSGPLTRATVKNHLKIADSFTADDDLIDQIILAATYWCEDWQGRTYVNRSRTHYLDRFPATIKLPYPPLVSVESIKYVDTDGTQQTLSSADYRVDTGHEPGRITPAYGLIWPAIRPVTSSITIAYTAGYGAAADVPDQVKAAVKLMCGFLYRHRDAVSEIKLQGHTLPAVVERLLWPERIV